MLTKAELRDNRYFTVFLACMVALGPLSVDAYLPAIPKMADFFGTNIATVNLTMSSFLIGSAIGQFFGGALSDQLGRKTIGLIGICFFIISTLFILFADNIETVQLFRLTQAIGSGFASVVCLAQVRDLYPKDEVMRRFANVMFVMFLAPLFGPTLGAGLVQFGWHSIFIFLAAWSLMIFILYVLFVPETINEKAEKFCFRELFTGYLRVINHRIDRRLVASRYILFGGISSGIFMTFLTNSALIFMEYFKASEFQFAVIFGAHAFMLMVGNRAAVKLSNLKGHSGLKILRLMNLLQLTLTISLFLAAYFDLLSLAGVLIFTLLTIGVNGAINPTTAGLFIVHFDKNAGAASSLKTTAIFISGAIFGGLAAVLSNGSLLPVFAIMALCSLMARGVLLTIREHN